MRTQRARDGFARARRRVHIGCEIVGIRRVEIGRFGGVDRRAAADRHVAVETSVARECGGLAKRGVGRFDLAAIVERRVDSGGAQRRERECDRLQSRNAFVAEERDPGHAQLLCGRAYLAQCAAAVDHPRRIHLKRRLAAVDERITLATQHAARFGGGAVAPARVRRGMLLGAIDVGTNSIHLIVVELDPRFGTSRTILKAREMVRLGGGAALSRGHLSKKALQRGVSAIARFVEAARAAGAADVRAVATSAVREASNRDEFLAAVRATSGLGVEVLSADEEARLIHLGVSRGYPIGDRTACIFDIGGGSTEFVIGDAHRPYYLRSVKLGSLRLYDEFLANESSEQLGYRALQRHVRETLQSTIDQLRDYRFDLLIGTSGTVMGLAALDAAKAGTPGQRAHGYVLKLARLRALQREMRALDPAERRKMPGMNPRRSDIIVAGNAIVMGILEALGREELIVCERALREGIVVDYIERNLAVARKLGDERTRRFDEAHALASRFGADDVHGAHVGGLALELFDGLSDLHGLEPAERDVLFAAAILHDVGRAISASAHHKHSAYIVRNAGLPGWRPDEIATIAALVRYHRKALPKPQDADVGRALAHRRRTRPAPSRARRLARRALRTRRGDDPRPRAAGRDAGTRGRRVQGGHVRARVRAASALRSGTGGPLRLRLRRERAERGGDRCGQPFGITAVFAPDRR